MENSENKIKIASLIINGINVIVIIIFIVYLFTLNSGNEYKALYEQIEKKLKISTQKVSELNKDLLNEKKQTYKLYLLADTLQKNISNLAKEDLNIKKYYNEVYTDIDNYNEYQLDSLFSVIKGDSAGL